MSKKMFANVLALVIMAAMVMTACAPAATQTPAAPQATDTTAAQPTATTAAAMPTETAAAQATDPAAATATVGATATTDAATATTAAPVVDMKYENVDPTGQKITFWHNQTSKKEEALKAIVADFNKTNQYKITVEATSQGAYADIFKKVMPILNTQDMPNLLVAYQNNAATYQLAGALADMTSMVSSPKYGLTADEQKDFFPAFFAQDIFPTYNNQRLGIAPNRSLEGLYYNADWLKELGYTDPPKTPDQFKEMACKAAKTPFTKATGKGKSMGFELAVNDASHFAAWTFAFGGDIYDAKTNQYTLNSDASVKAMQFIQGMFKDGCAAQPAEQYGDQTDFGTGNLLFAIGSTSGMSFYSGAVASGAKFNWQLATVPYTTSTPVVDIYGASISIPKSTPEKELAAWIFLKYFTSPEVNAKWAQTSAYFPSRQSAAKSMTDFLGKNPQYKVGFDLLQYGKYEPPVPGYDFVRSMIQDEALAVIVSSPYPDVKPILDKVNDEANANLKDQLSQIKK